MLFPSLSWAGNQYSLTKIGYPQGLSNSAVLSVFRDDKGFMWFSTYDGLNRYDGKKMKVYRSDLDKGDMLLNNTIYQVDASGKDHLWISTSAGLNHFSYAKQSMVESHEIFNDEYRLYANRKGDSWLFKKENLYYYDHKLNKFILGSHPQEFFNRNLPFVDEEGALWLFASEDQKIYRCVVDSTASERITVNVNPVKLHKKRIDYTYYQQGILAFVDRDCDLFLVDLVRNSKVYIRNVADLTNRYGTINGIVSFHDDIILSFIQNGLIKLDGANKYKASVVDNSIRIFSIYKDPVQDIIWVGTDGQGVMAYSRKNTLATHLMFSQLQNKIVRQVRSIYTDPCGDLWFGTKGDGLVRVKNYDQKPKEEVALSDVSVYFPGMKHTLEEYNRGTDEFQVFGIIPSRFRNLLWIGSSDAPALSYYDYQKDQVIPLSGELMDVRKIHQVYEQNDSTLWVTSSGTGFQKFTIVEEDNRLKVKRSQQVQIFKGKNKVDDFFSMTVEGDSVIWLGSRGMGLVRFSLSTQSSVLYHLGAEEFTPINDILSIYQKGKTFYLGTVSGLVCVRLDEHNMGSIYCIDRNRGLLNDMVHGVLEDNNGFLWLSTNKGLVKYNPENTTFHTYYYSNGFQIGEFCDDAFYKSPQTGKLYFGGIEGLLSLEKEGDEDDTYQPDVSFYNLTLGVKSVNINDYYDKNANSLVFKGKLPTLALTFTALDFIEGDNFEYSYRLEGSSHDEWSAFSPENYAKFNSLPYGKYTLHVRYKKDVFDADYKSYSINIHVVHPWYLSIWAILAYMIVVAVVSVYGFILARKYYRREKLVKELMKHEIQKSDMHKVSTRYHELATSFSHIYRMCGQLRKDSNLPDGFQNLLDVTHETILSFAFRSEGGHNLESFIDDYLPVNVPVYDELSVKDLSDELIRMIIYRGQEDLSALTVEIPDDLKVALPKYTLGYILYFLYNRSLESKEQMKIEASLESAHLILRVETSDVLTTDLLDNHQSEIEALNDDFSSYLYQWLCAYALRTLHAQIEHKGDGIILSIPILPITSAPEVAPGKDKKTVLLLEDKSEMVWLVSDLLADDYVVHQVTTAQEAFSYLRKNSPDVFMADTLIYMNKENKFIEYVESNKGLLMGTVFIPMLTWNAAFLSHRDLVRLVDGFVLVPYSILFLKEIVRFATNRVAKNPETLVELPGRQEFVYESTDQANFVKKLMQILDENLDKEDLNTTFIAEQMNISLRQYYRKFKEVSTLSSTDFIKKYRIERAARLLVETDAPVQEIIESVGIQSRSYFYKEFSARFGCTPKAYQKQMQANAKQSE